MSTSSASIPIPKRKRDIRPQIEDENITEYYKEKYISNPKVDATNLDYEKQTNDGFPGRTIIAFLRWTNYRDMKGKDSS